MEGFGTDSIVEWKVSAELRMASRESSAQSDEFLLSLWVSGSAGLLSVAITLSFASRITWTAEPLPRGESRYAALGQFLVAECDARSDRRRLFALPIGKAAADGKLHAVGQLDALRLEPTTMAAGARLVTDHARLTTLRTCRSNAGIRPIP